MLNIQVTGFLNNYKNKKQIIFNDDIYNKWSSFINDNKYKTYFD